MKHFPLPSLTQLALAIVSGEDREPYGPHSLFTPAEWASEAQGYLDSGCDASSCDLEYMVQQEEDAERGYLSAADRADDYADYLYEQKRDREMEAQWERGL